MHYLLISLTNTDYADKRIIDAKRNNIMLLNICIDF
ncbi:MAG: hypothetical protein K0Q79_3102 [Flavipsychrobacter sp.]|jgi:hypothetical protein|nr:hypothetical protein [Flavipsychrobacter sp.]